MRGIEAVDKFPSTIIPACLGELPCRFRGEGGSHSSAPAAVVSFIRAIRRFNRSKHHPASPSVLHTRRVSGRLLSLYGFNPETSCGTMPGTTYAWRTIRTMIKRSSKSEYFHVLLNIS